MADLKNNGVRDDYAEYPMIIKEFIRYSSVIKGKSKLSIDGYALDLKLFFRFIMLRRNLVPANTDFKDIDISSIDIEFIKTISLMMLMIFWLTVKTFAATIQKPAQEKLPVYVHFSII